MADVEQDIDKAGFHPQNKRLAFFGGVPERSKGSDCKSDGSAFGGSNPPPSTTQPPASRSGRWPGRLRGAHRGG